MPEEQNINTFDDSAYFDIVGHSLMWHDCEVLSFGLMPTNRGDLTLRLLLAYPDTISGGVLFKLLVEFHSVTIISLHMTLTYIYDATIEPIGDGRSRITFQNNATVDEEALVAQMSDADFPVDAYTYSFEFESAVVRVLSNEVKHN